MKEKGRVIEIKTPQGVMDRGETLEKLDELIFALIEVRAHIKQGLPVQCHFSLDLNSIGEKGKEC